MEMENDKHKDPCILHLKAAECDDKDCNKMVTKLFDRCNINLNIAIDFTLAQNKKFSLPNSLHNS